MMAEEADNVRPRVSPEQPHRCWESDRVGSHREPPAARRQPPRPSSQPHRCWESDRVGSHREPPAARRQPPWPPSQRRWECRKGSPEVRRRLHRKSGSDGWDCALAAASSRDPSLQLPGRVMWVGGQFLVCPCEIEGPPGGACALGFGTLQRLLISGPSVFAINLSVLAAHVSENQSC